MTPFLRPGLLGAAAMFSGMAGAGQPSLFVVRASSVSMAAMNAEVLVEGLDVVTLGPNGCAAFEPATGVRQLRYRWRAGPLGNATLDTEYTSVPVALSPEKAAYLRLLSHTESVRNARGGFDATTTWKMERVAEREVRSYLSRCKGRALEQGAQD